MFGSFDISASALTAQRIRLDTIMSNTANVDSIKGADGTNSPYRRQVPIFAAQAMGNGRTGVQVSQIAEDDSDFIERVEPGNPLRDKFDKVKYPNVNLSTEMINSIDASRAYEANVNAIETTKSMMSATLRILG